MASRPKTNWCYQKFLNKTFEGGSLDSSTAKEILFGHDNHAEEEDDGYDGPVVFICAKCRLPVGDSLSWDGSEYEENQIKLKRVTDNVQVGKEHRLLEVGKRSLCITLDLICRGCHVVLGMVFTSTPKQLDHKRFTFCFNVADIDSYVLGSANQMMAAEGSDEKPVTLEYRGFVEQQLSEEIYHHNSLSTIGALQQDYVNV
ncbi:protein Mis18-alpha isoform X2 [Oryzias latipes]|uniref:protein Mis18-alpha isoform X2 n=1 Tax=Oryzias latipes TaxID=8090 RepID=UPI0002A4C3B5|nr:protein Mis18-alpha isoform X2 [Oryzias latipes]